MPGRVVLVSSNGRGVGVDVFVQSAQSVGLSCEMLPLPENGGVVALPDETAEASSRIKILILLATPGAEPPEYERCVVAAAGVCQADADRGVLVLCPTGLFTSTTLLYCSLLQLGRAAKQRDRQVFIIMYSALATEDGFFRVHCFEQVRHERTYSS